MKCHFEGNHIGITKLHLIQYFDGFKLREIEVLTLDGFVYWLESPIYGILQPGDNFRNAKRRLAAFEKRCCQRIG